MGLPVVVYIVMAQTKYATFDAQTDNDKCPVCSCYFDYETMACSNFGCEMYD